MGIGDKLSMKIPENTTLIKKCHIYWPVWLNGWVFVYELSGCGFESPVSSKQFLDIQATIECKFTLTLVRDMIITYIQTHRTDKYSQHSSII